MKKMIKFFVFLALTITVFASPVSHILANDTTVPFANTVITFNDSKIEDSVRSTLKIPAPTAITKGDLASLKGLYLTTSGSYDLSGLEDAVNLTSLFIDAKDKETIHIADLSPIFSIPLTSINFKTPVTLGDDSQLTNWSSSLTSLLIQDAIPANDLSIISSFPNLVELIVRAKDNGMAFDATPISSLSKLEKLTLRGLNFNDTLNLNNVPLITSIGVSDTDIKNFDFINPNSLITYTLFQNNTQLVDATRLGDISTIETLQITNSQLQDVSFLSTLTNLKSVYLYGNQIVDMSPIINNPSNIKMLHLDGNNLLNDVSFLNTLTFTNDATIDLSKNNISDISALSSFNAANPGMTLRLSGNKIVNFAPFSKFEGNSNIRIIAINQSVKIDDAIVNEAYQLPLVAHSAAVTWQAFSMADLGNTGYGSFSYAKHMITWDEVTPQATPNYNRFHLANFDITETDDTLWPSIAYHANIVFDVNLAAPVTSYDVIFDSNGGSIVDAILGVSPGSTLAAPTAPTKAGYTFEGWYSDNATFEHAWNFASNTVNANMTLYAKWTEVTPTNPVIPTLPTTGLSNYTPLIGSSLVLVGFLTLLINKKRKLGK